MTFLIIVFTKGNNFWGGGLGGGTTKNLLQLYFSNIYIYIYIYISQMNGRDFLGPMGVSYGL
jgi:hypothetical protein